MAGYVSRLAKEITNYNSEQGFADIFACEQQQQLNIDLCTKMQVYAKLQRTIPNSTRKQLLSIFLDFCNLWPAKANIYEEIPSL